MDPIAIPRRPRLAEHALARLHRVGADTFVVVFDQRDGRSYQLGLREWVLLSVADGTRDLEGIRLAGTHEGALATPEAIHDFVSRLSHAGLLADGLPDFSTPPSPSPLASTTDDPRARPLDPLPGYRFHCDGSGVCCHQYATIVFSTLEAARARVLLPLLEDGGARHERVFTPRKGSVQSPACAVKHVDGACAYLDDAGLCRIHAAGGASAKPFGCNLFPARFVDDGEAVRVTTLVECACVVRSAATSTTHGDPLIDPTARTRADLASEVFVEVLPPHISLTATATTSRATLVAWDLSLRDAPPADLAAWLWTTADDIEHTSTLPTSPRARPIDVAAFTTWLRALGVITARVATESFAWRGPADVVRQAFDALREVLTMLGEDRAVLAALLAAPPSQPDAEAHFFRATAHGHQWLAGRPLATQLRNLAMRVVLARMMHRFVRAGMLTDKAFAEPVALVEAMCRGHGLHVDGISLT